MIELADTSILRGQIASRMALSAMYGGFGLCNCSLERKREKMTISAKFTA